MHRRSLLRSAGVLGAAAVASPLFAQDYPNRPIRLLLAFPAGGSTDAIMRLIAENAGKILGQTVVVEPRPGAGGTLAASALQTAPPDGYTIAQIATGVYRLPFLARTTWDPIRDLKYIVGVSGYTFGVAVPADGPIKNWNDYVAYAKARPGELTFGTVGPMSTPYLTMASVSQKLGVKMLHVPYKGSGDLIQAMLAGQIMSIADSTSFAPYVQSGKFRFISVWTANRLPKYPDTPTLREHGLDVVQTSPVGFAAPRDTPAPVIKRLHDALKQAAEQPNFLELLGKYDMVPNYMNSEAYTKFAQESVAADKLLLESLGMKPL